MHSHPLYKTIKERIRADILQLLDTDARIPSERDLQERYQVSRPTIGKALAALAGEGFLIQMHRRGSYRVAHAGNKDERTAASPPRQIGFVAPLAGEELVQRAFRGIDRIAHRRGYRVLMGNAGHEFGCEQVTVRDFIAAGVCGLIINPCPRREAQAAQDYLLQEDQGVPVVLLDTAMVEQGRTQVLFDNERLGYAMTTQLLQRGHQRIALLTYARSLLHGPLMARLNGYLDALTDHALPHDPALVGRYETGHGAKGCIAAILESWLALSCPPTAIIATEDMAALDVIAILTEWGVRVPQEIEVVGFDNRSAAHYFHPPFTTSSPDFERMGEIACQLLLQEIETGSSAPRTYFLEVPILARGGKPALTEAQAAVSAR